MQHDELKVPIIRRKPDRVSQEQWEPFVEGLFPKSPAVKYRVVLRGEHRGDSHCTCPVFRYGVYGTCPHILHARSQLEHSGEHLHSGASPDAKDRPYSEIFLRYGLKREIVFRPAHNAPRTVLRVARSCFHANGLFQFDQYPALKKLIERAAACRHELYIDDDVFAQLAFEMQQRERLRTIMAAFPRGVQSHAFGSLLTAPLAVYQREAALGAATAGRFLLFDSPGLGRRRTAVAAAEILAQTACVHRVLILTNTPTLHTWLAELQQSTSRPAQVVFGTSAKRSQCYGADMQYTIARYDDLKDDLAAITSRMRPDLVILDETHTLKRHGAETARIVRRIESEYLFILSGAAPARVPGPFVSFVDMIDRHRTGLLDHFLARHQQFDLRSNSVNYVNMSNVANTLPKHFRRFESSEYRRSLPEWIEHDRYLPLTELQAKRHADLQSRLFHLASGFRFPTSDGGHGVTTPPPEVQNPKLEASSQDSLPSGGRQLPLIAPPEVPVRTLHEIQAILAEMLNTANDMACCRFEIGNTPLDPTQSSGCKIDTMYELLQEHLESPQVKAVVFAHDMKLLQLARAKLVKSPVGWGLIDRYMSPNDQKNAGARFQREPNCRVLFVSDGVDDRLNFKSVQLVIHLDFPWNSDCIRQRHAHVTPYPTIRPCHAYQLISYGTMEHWLAKLRGNDQLLFGSDLRDGQSVVLLDEPGRVKFFEHVTAILGQAKEPPMVMPSPTLTTLIT